jgi:hypothetical protein
MRITNPALWEYIQHHQNLSEEGIAESLRGEGYRFSKTRFNAVVRVWIASTPNSPYKGMPGFKESGTSKEAGRSLAKNGRADTLRDKCMGIFLDGWQLTADQVARKLGEDILSIRPRISELAHTFPPAIRKTDETRMGDRGKPQRVMALNV